MFEFNLLDVRFILFLFPHDGSLGRFSRNVQGGTIQGSGIGYHLTTLVLEGFLLGLCRISYDFRDRWLSAHLPRLV